MYAHFEYVRSCLHIQYRERAIQRFVPSEQFYWDRYHDSAWDDVAHLLGIDNAVVQCVKQFSDTKIRTNLLHNIILEGAFWTQSAYGGAKGKE